MARARVEDGRPVFTDPQGGSHLDGRWAAPELPERPVHALMAQNGLRRVSPRRTARRGPRDLIDVGQRHAPPRRSVDAPRPASKRAARAGEAVELVGRVAVNGDAQMGRPRTGPKWDRTSPSGARATARLACVRFAAPSMFSPVSHRQALSRMDRWRLH
jgi:hypothetical protein